MCWFSEKLTNTKKKEPMSYNNLLRSHQQEFAFNLSLLIQRVHYLGCRVTLGETYRTEDQQYLYFHGKNIENGKLVDGKKKSWTMNSSHLKRLAIDINLFIPSTNGHDLSWDSEYHKELGEYWESLDSRNKYAVTLKDGTKTDLGHFEMKID